MTKRKPKKRASGKIKQRRKKKLSQLSPAYRRRIKRGQSKGLSRSQAGGHPKRNENYASPKRVKNLTDNQKRNLSAIIYKKKLVNVKDAARNIGISQQRLTKILSSSPYTKKVNGVWQPTDDAPTHFVTYSNGKEQKVTVTYKASQEIGAYRDAVGEYLETLDTSHLDPYKGKSVTDIKTGKIYPYETRPNKLHIIDAAGITPIEGIYSVDLRD